MENKERATISCTDMQDVYLQSAMIWSFRKELR